MTITTKFNIGDTVWFAEKSKAIGAKIKFATISSPDPFTGGFLVTYHFSPYLENTSVMLGMCYMMTEDQCYRTKEELIASL